MTVSFFISFFTAQC